MYPVAVMVAWVQHFFSTKLAEPFYSWTSLFSRSRWSIPLALSFSDTEHEAPLDGLRDQEPTRVAYDADSALDNSG